MANSKKAGRPFSTYALDEPKNQRVEIAITPTAYKWLKGQKRGFLSQLVETMAREKLQTALSEIGEIEPWWSDEDQMFVFEHPAYPRVSHADADKAKTKAGYLRALEGFLEDRLAGHLAEEAERVTSGLGGTDKKEIRCLDADMAEWLDVSENRQKVRQLMQA